MKHKNLKFVISITSIFVFYGIIFSLCFFLKPYFPAPGVRDNAYEKADLTLIYELSPSNIGNNEWELGNNKVSNIDDIDVISFTSSTKITSPFIDSRSHRYVEFNINLNKNDDIDINVDGYNGGSLLQSGKLTKNDNGIYSFAFSFNFYNIDRISFTNYGKNIYINSISVYNLK